MNKTLSIKINSAMDGQRIDCILEKHLKISSGLITRLKKYDDGILLNGVKKFVIDKVSSGDLLVVNIKGENTENITPCSIPLHILFEDEDIIVVNKPCGMAVHPSRAHINGTLANGVLYHMNTNQAIHIITRLDRETSGVVLVAKNPWSAAILSEQMKNNIIKKEYVAIVNGVPKNTLGTISAPIKRKADGKIERCVSCDGKEAVTLYELIKNSDKLSLVKLIPVTGRTHQLRVHMSYIGHPIFGDTMYGAVQSGERTRLHCSKLTFFHPVTDEKVTVIAKTPEDFNIY